MTVAELFNAMKERVAANPAKIASLNGSYLFEVTGEGGGTFHAVFANGAADIGEGAIADPGCTVTVAASDFMAMVAGKLNPAAAFMAGKVRIRGDMGLAMKLQMLLG